MGREGIVFMKQKIDEVYIKVKGVIQKHQNSVRITCDPHSCEKIVDF